MTPPLLFELQRGVATVTLSRPPANAINLEALTALGQILPRLSEPDVRAVVLRGQGRFFSAGLDLFEIMEYDAQKTAAFARAFDVAMRGWFALDKPVIAALNGHAVAGGLVLAATADFRIGAEGAGKVGLTEILVGVPFPATALEPVRFSFPGAVVSQMVFRGTTWTMAEGRSLGLVDQLVSPEALDEAALNLALELGGHTRAGFSGTKASLRAPTLARLSAAPGEDHAWTLWRDAEVQERMVAYRERTLRKA